jgi:hypothetical protein
MKIAKRTWKPLDYLDETKWQEVLDKHSFWREAEAYLSEGELHQKLAYFVMVANGETAWKDTLKPSPHPFDQVAMPTNVLADPQIQSLMSQWLGLHEAVYGEGQPLKMGFYCVAPGGSCGYHVDGSVLDLGERVDLSTEEAQMNVIAPQLAHRTVLPLRVNANDEFLIAGQKVRMTPGLLFEFSNTYPHALFNKGDEYTVLLVTTWLPKTEWYSHNLIDLK